MTPRVILFAIISSVCFAQDTLPLGEIVGETQIAAGRPFKFRFRAETRDRISFYVNDLLGSACFGATITDANNNPLLTRSCTTSSPTVANFAPPTNGIFSAEITTSRADARFWMVLSCDGPCAMSSQDETAAGALSRNTIRPGVPEFGILDGAQRIRRFAFPARLGSKYEVRLSRQSGNATPRFNLYNQAGKFISGATTPISSARTQTFEATSTGAHQVVIFDSNYKDDMKYRFEVACLLPCADPPGFPDPTIVLGDIVGETEINPDKTFSFQFNATSRDRPTLYINDLVGSGFFCVTIVANGGQRIVDNRCSSNAAILTNQVLPVDGSYRAEISTPRADARFWMVLGCDGSCSSQPPEGGEPIKILPVLPLATGAPQPGLLTTKEKVLRFAFEALATNSYQLRFTRRSGPGQPNFNLYNENARYIPSSGNLSTSVRSQTFTATSNGVHQAVLFESGYNSDIPYIFEVTCLAPCRAVRASSELVVSPSSARIRVGGDQFYQPLAFSVRTAVPGAAVNVEAIGAPWMRVSPRSLVAPGAVSVSFEAPPDLSSVKTGYLKFSLNSGNGAPLLIPIEIESDAVSVESFEVDNSSLRIDTSSNAVKEAAVAITSTSSKSIRVTAKTALPRSVLSIKPDFVDIEPGETRYFSLEAKGSSVQDTLRSGVLFSSANSRRLVDVAIIRLDGQDVAVRVAPSSLELFGSRNWPQNIYIWTSGAQSLEWRATTTSTDFVAEPRFAVTLPGSKPNQVTVALGTTAQDLFEPSFGSLVFEIGGKQIELGLTAFPVNLVAPSIVLQEAAVILESSVTSAKLKIGYSGVAKSIATFNLQSDDEWLLVDGLAASVGISRSLQSGTTQDVLISVKPGGAPAKGTRAFLKVSKGNEQRIVEVVYRGLE